MIQHKRTFSLGIFIFLIPFLGLPSSWKTTLVVLSGLSLVFLSVKIVLPKKPIKIKSKKPRPAPTFAQNIPVYPPDENDTTKIKVVSKENKTE